MQGNSYLRGSKSCFMLFYAILSEIWDLDGPYCTNLGYKLVVMVWMENKLNVSYVNKAWLLHKEVAKICQMQGYWYFRGSKSRFILFIRNMVFKWSILHCSWEQISYNCLENNLNGSQVRKAWSWHQEVAKYAKMQGNWPFGRSKSRFMLFWYWISKFPYCTNLGYKLVVIV